MLAQMVYPNFIINSSPSHHRCLSISLMLFICGANAEEGKNLGVRKEGVWGWYLEAVFQDGSVWLVSVWSLFLKLQVGFISVCRKGIHFLKEATDGVLKASTCIYTRAQCPAQCSPLFPLAVEMGEEKVGTNKITMNQHFCWKHKFE